MTSWIKPVYIRRPYPASTASTAALTPIAAFIANSISSPIPIQEDIIPFITFIIPTINRDTLNRTLLSIQKQTVPHWNAIVIFDGCNPIHVLPDDKRFQYIFISKVGSKHKKRNTAGFVRNYGMNLVNTPWIGFVDDDDIITPNYIKHLMEETRITPDADLISFRMIDNNLIIPPPDCVEIKEGHIGISFAIKTQLVKEGYIFTQDSVEDYNFVKKIQNANKKIVISPYISYLVNNSNYIEESVNLRVVIN